MAGQSQQSSANFNPRSPRGERPMQLTNTDGTDAISIHAPREGSDSCRETLVNMWRISIHAPREGSDTLSLTPYPFTVEFQSTLPTRGATNYLPALQPATMNFNPRSPRGERPDARILVPRHCRFQSTLPARGATLILRVMPPQRWISIHAPREGSDQDLIEYPRPGQNFNPRSLRGERRRPRAVWLSGVRFQSTLPARGATIVQSSYSRTTEFQSTLPARGATLPAATGCQSPDDFNPRSPRGERRKSFPAPQAYSTYFNPRSPRGERPRSSKPICGTN